MNTLRLKKHEERRLREGHLWIYSNEVDTAVTPLKTLTPGEQVLIEDFSGKVLGIATAQPNSLICARLVSRDVKHPLNKSLLVHRIQQALSLRERFYDEPYYRLVYGDSDFLPGLVVDRFGDYLVVQINSAGMDLVKDEVVEALEKVLSPKGILFRNDGKARVAEGLESYVAVASGDVPQEVELLENGVKFLAPVHAGQKTGWFFDHRENRARLKGLVEGKRVLDVFSYAGSWGVQAAVFGASEVVCVDASEFALDYVEKNAALNGVAEKVGTFQGDAFQVLAELKEQGEHFDVIILDPPAFIQKRKDHGVGLQAYRRLNELAMRLLTRDGLLVSGSCSMHLGQHELVDVMRAASRHIDRLAQVVYQGGQGPDHPVNPAITETAYLKCVMARVMHD
ncbi:MAG: class I SAM-dependent rRNA methyltransferase [Fluviicoccus sp.]|uniref:class I SAM-dependent rRNA methyltransferase n=1 Tax=Fluviicoccus sp. TaxID=2003552 RepID=UPI0027250781|nr:class I SAM-dependent rRNA methyltransferase [Fluviicoccus sp.]MDO8330332.1 class I SAM-dependent rRNA methyltransferase [Fluviicoccus sp.]